MFLSPKAEIPFRTHHYYARFFSKIGPPNGKQSARVVRMFRMRSSSSINRKSSAASRSNAVASCCSIAVARGLMAGAAQARFHTKIKAPGATSTLLLLVFRRCLLNEIVRLCVSTNRREYKRWRYCDYTYNPVHVKVHRQAIVEKRHRIQSLAADSGTPAARRHSHTLATRFCTV